MSTLQAQITATYSQQAAAALTPTKISLGRGLSLQQNRLLTRSKSCGLQTHLWQETKYPEQQQLLLELLHLH